MSVLSGLLEPIQEKSKHFLTVLRQKAFGYNNERIDFVLDSFYKLTPTQRNGVIGGGVAILGGFVFGAIMIYFSQVASLEGSLSKSFVALQKLKVQTKENKITSARFDQMVDSIRRKVNRLNVKPLFERLSRDRGVELRNINIQEREFDSSNPASEKLKELLIEMRLPKISIPRLLKFIEDIEKSGKFLRVYDMKITGLFGNKLFFDVSLIVHGYKPL